MNIILQPTRAFLKEFPEYKGKECVFLGWNARENKKWVTLLIRVRIGNGRIQYFASDWFRDLRL